MRYDLIKAHAFSSHHKEKLLNDKICGCFYCGQVFAPSKITDWLETEDTGLCPYCGIDAIIGESCGYPITTDFLKHMREAWFSGM